jgi:hypothetical protein
MPLGFHRCIFICLPSQVCRQNEGTKIHPKPMRTSLMYFEYPEFDGPSVLDPVNHGAPSALGIRKCPHTLELTCFKALFL